MFWKNKEVNLSQDNLGQDKGPILPQFSRVEKPFFSRKDEFF